MVNLVKKNDLDIDKNNLDEEWLNQPALYGTYALLAASARQSYDEAKVALDVTKAEVDKAIRNNPEDFGLSKLTESVINTTIPAQEAYKIAMKEVIEAKHHLDILIAMVSALDHRKTALSKLVDLLLADYFSKPMASEEAKEMTDQMEKRTARRRARVRPKAED